MDSVAEVTDRLISSNIDLLKTDLLNVATKSESLFEEERGEYLTYELSNGVKYRSLTVLSPTGVRESYGAAKPTDAFLESDEIENAFSGEGLFSSTEKAVDGTQVFFLSVPYGENVLIGAIEGEYFSKLIRGVNILDTGNIFIDDSEGNVIAAEDPDWVINKYNYLEISKTDKSYESAGNFVREMLKEREGIARFELRGAERICSYRPVTTSKDGWIVGVVAPIKESPAHGVQNALLMMTLVFMIIAVIVTVPVSRILAKPFDLMSAKNEELEDLNEEVKRASEAKTTFLANMSHEMRTPLNAIIGISELMLDAGDVNAEQKNNLEKIYTSGSSLLGIVNDILDVSKIESGKFEIVPTSYDTPSLINDTIIINITRVAGKPIKFTVDVSPDFPASLFGDELRIKQVFNNLLSNAFKYTKAGSVHWIIYGEADKEPGYYNIISEVKDTGIGIKPEDIRKLFAEYRQIDSKANRLVEGTGLGLVITQQLLDLMDGSISVKSVYGKGSTFTVRIKQKLLTDDVIGKKIAANLGSMHYLDEKRSRDSKLARAKMPYARVLIVDDVPTNLDVAKGLLKPYEMTIDCVSSGEESIEIIKAGEPHYDAIFMDHMMPGIDGIEATHLIRDLGTDYAKNIPVIALTANATIGNEEMFLAEGFQAFVSKPISIKELDSVVNEWVRDLDKEKAEDVASSDSATVAESVSPAPSAPSAPSEYDGKLKKYMIYGVDIEKGVAAFGGDDVYIDVLRSYAVNTPTLLDSIREIDASKLDEQRITIHGIKGSSYAIKADIVGMLAERLEDMAKVGDADFVKEHAPELINQVELLLSDIEILLEDVDDEMPIKESPDNEIISRLIYACENFDTAGVDAAMEELEGYRYISNPDLLPWLRDKIIRMEYTEIIEKLNRRS
jgi:signal transduction histidine kinase/DNA-binding NarL/FixJ family response regulator/HPt (histidine-containing phosphotransfer) domain-containing protein